MSEHPWQPWLQIDWESTAWTADELRKAVEIHAAIAWWLGHNDPGTPIPDWCYLTRCLRKSEVIDCWEMWNKQRKTAS